MEYEVLGYAEQGGKCTCASSWSGFSFFAALKEMYSLCKENCYKIKFSIVFRRLV